MAAQETDKPKNPKRGAKAKEKAKIPHELGAMSSEVDKGGRPKEYSEIFLNADGSERAEMFELLGKLSKSGLTDEQIGKVFSVERATISQWKKEQAKFSDTIEVNKDRFDNGAVKRSLFERAMGYTVPETKVFIVNGKPLKVEIEKHIIPDTTAQQYWLNNRQPDEWRSVNHIDYTNRMPTGLSDLDLSKLNEEDLELLEYIVKKAQRETGKAATDE